MFKVSKEIKILFLVFLLAFVLRVYELSTFPFGFHADEARVGWNALSILKTGADDRGNKFALYYNTFGDFRPTGIFYVTIPSLVAFGRNEFAVRFPSALLGALTVFPLYFFVLTLTKKKNIALLSGLLFAIYPWHIEVSRATSEVIMALFISMWGFYLFLKGLEEKKKFLVFLSSVFFGISYFFYHSIRLSAPIFIFILVFYFWKQIKTSKLTKIVFISLGFLSLLTFILISNKDARGRFSQVSIFNDLDVQYELSRMPFEEGQGKVFIARLFHNKPSVYTRRFINEYANYFSANFFLNSVVPKPARYQTVGVGLLTYIEFFLLLAGLIAIAKKKEKVLPLLFLLIAPIPAALTTEDAPNLHRAFFMIPFLVIIEAYGFYFLVSSVKKFQTQIKYILFSLLALNTIFFLHMYFVHNKVHLPLYRNVGAKELAIYLNEVKGNYDKIILTNIPDDPYPWIAFFTGRNPAVFNKDAINRDKGVWTSENFVFTGQRCPSRDAFVKPEVKRLLVVDAEGCATESKLKDRSDVKLLNVIKRPDGSEVYNIWSRIE